MSGSPSREAKSFSLPNRLASPAAITMQLTLFSNCSTSVFLNSGSSIAFFSPGCNSFTTRYSPNKITLSKFLSVHLKIFVL